MEWPLRSLADLASPERGAIKIGPFGSQLKKSELTDGGVHVVGIENVLAQKFDGFGERYITAQKYDTLRAVEIKPGDVVITMMGTVGRAAVVPQGTSLSIMDSHLLRFRPNRDLCEPYFVAWFLQSPHARAAMNRLAHGAIMKGLNSGIVRSLPIPLPSLSEQRRIVEFLDQADRLRRLRTEADAKANRILPAIFLRMFGDPATNPMGWRAAPLGDAIVETQYGTSRRANMNGQGVILLRMNNITTSGEIDLGDVKFVDLEPTECERQLLRSGDIVFNRTNSVELVGKTGLWRESELSVVAASYLIRIRVDPDQLIPSYAWALMNTSYMKNVLATTARRAVGMANINATELRHLPWMFPPLQLQEGFAAVSDSIRQLNETRNHSLNATRQMFLNLLNRAFSGTLTAS